MAALALGRRAYYSANPSPVILNPPNPPILNPPNIVPICSRGEVFIVRGWGGFSIKGKGLVVYWVII